VTASGGAALDLSAVQALGVDDVGSASAVIARAFHDDPLTVHLYPDEQQRMRIAPVMFEALVRYDFLFGQVDHLPGFTAVAAWMRPGETAETADRLAAAGFDNLPTEVPLARLDAFFATIGPAHKQAAPEPHWYLRLLGVDPDHQGMGLGSILLDHGLRRADATRQPCYLETFAERNVPFYLRHGFELVVDETEPLSGIRTWGFYRAQAH
jgi:GNAT superfamily N-acetyltransferase